MTSAVVHERRAAVLGIRRVVIGRLISVGEHRDHRLGRLTADGREAEQENADDHEAQHRSSMTVTEETIPNNPELTDRGCPTPVTTTDTGGSPAVSPSLAALIEIAKRGGNRQPHLFYLLHLVTRSQRNEPTRVAEVAKRACGGNADVSTRVVE